MGEISTEDLEKLIKKYNRLSTDDKKKYSESDVSTKFIQPLIKILGWNVDDINEVREQRTAGVGRADFVLALENEPKIVIETKKFETNLDGRQISSRNEEKSYPDQVIEYAWHLKSRWAVLTNFEEIRLYSSGHKNPNEGLLFSISINELKEHINDLCMISKQSILENKLDTLQLRNERATIDKEILKDLEDMRNLLRNDIHMKAKTQNDEELRQLIQIFIDRMLVIRVAEDRGILPYDMLKSELELWKKHAIGDLSFIPKLRLVFDNIEHVYNTNLFKKSRIDEIEIGDDVIKKIVTKLYDYNFELIDADILGAIYEDYLTRDFINSAYLESQIADVGEKRKKGGIYYTPVHMVEYILENTLKTKLKECKEPSDVEQIKIIDISCGSGSFLIKAFDIINKWYENYNTNIRQRSTGTIDGAYKEIDWPAQTILKHNLFGIDIDPQACEIASMNLMLKALKKDTKMDPILGHNIKTGNSLISGDEDEFAKLGKFEKLNLKPFSFAKEFSGQRFDIIVGNPPYFKIRDGDLIKKFDVYRQIQSGPVNAAMMFINKAIDLLAINGMLGLVIPKMCAYTKGWRGTREKIFKKVQLTKVIDCQTAFDKVLLEQIMLIGRLDGSKGSTYETGIATKGSVFTTAKVNQNEAEKNDLIFLEADKKAYVIREKMLKNGTLCKDLSFEIILGEGIQSWDCWTDESSNGIKILSGVDISPYLVTPIQYFRKNEPKMKNLQKSIEKLCVPHIVCQRIVAHSEKPTSHAIIACGYEPKGAFAFNTVTHVLTKNQTSAFFLLGVLNSRLIAYYTHKFIYCNAIRSMDLYEDYLGRIPIPNVTDKDMNAISRLAMNINKHVSSEKRIKPNIYKYLKEKKCEVALSELLKNIKTDDKKLLDLDTSGKHIALYVQEKNNWIVFQCEFSTNNSKTVIRKKIDVLRVRIHDKSFREFLIYDINKNLKRKTRSTKQKKLVEFVKSIPVTLYKDDIIESQKKVIRMLEPYMREQKNHTKWKKQLHDLENRLDNTVFKAFHLTKDEIDHVCRETTSVSQFNYTRKTNLRKL